jgi:hypothetical protein
MFSVLNRNAPGTIATGAFVALTVCSSLSLADDPDSTRDPASKPGSMSNTELASKLANLSAPVLRLNVFMGVVQNGGSAPDAHRASFRIALLPVLPFVTKHGNLSLRPHIGADFGKPYHTSAGNVEGGIGFSDIQLDSVFGDTLKCGLIIMGGAYTNFPTDSNPALRAEWATGPEIVIGYSSKKTGSVFGALVYHTWSFSSGDRTVGGQYWYAISLINGWHIAAYPFWDYSVETKTLLFPLGIGFTKTSRFGKGNFPVRLGAQIWAYIPPPDATGPEWTVRVLVGPVVPRPWQKQGPGTLRTRRAAGR